MTDAESEFLKAIAAIQPIVVEPLEYRIYYDTIGNITSCSMQAHAPGNYVVTDKATYDAYYLYKVIKDRLVKIEHNAAYSARLKKSNTGYLVVKNNASIILEHNETYKDTEYYESTN